MDQYQEHCEFNYSTATEWDNAEASEIGAANPDMAWICTGRDVWHANPYYTGEPQPHPEDEYAQREAAEREAWRHGIPGLDGQPHQE